MLLIESREPAPLEPEPGRRRNWPLLALRLSWRLVCGLGLVLLSGAFAPVEAYALILAACVLIGRGLAGVVQGTGGLGDYHQ